MCTLSKRIYIFSTHVHMKSIINMPRVLLFIHFSHTSECTHPLVSLRCLFHLLSFCCDSEYPGHFHQHFMEFSVFYTNLKHRRTIRSPTLRRNVYICVRLCVCVCSPNNNYLCRSSFCVRYKFCKLIQYISMACAHHWNERNSICIVCFKRPSLIRPILIAPAPPPSSSHALQFNKDSVNAANVHRTHMLHIRPFTHGFTAKLIVKPFYRYTWQRSSSADRITWILISSSSLLHNMCVKCFQSNETSQE